MSKVIFYLSLLVFLLVVIFATAFLLGNEMSDENIVVDDFFSCVEAGNPVMESYPRQCRHGEKLFVEEIGNGLEKRDLIRLESPRPNEEISSPLRIKGEARGFWFFEASFPIVLTDWDGKIIAESFIMTADDWMTEDFVSFEGILEFQKPSYGKRGSLILHKDNPSGLPEHDDALEIPVFFK